MEVFSQRLNTMYMPDMSPYTDESTERELLAVGWLEKGHPFTKGAVSEAFLDALFDACVNKQVNLMRGWHPCGLCSNAPYPIKEHRNGINVSLGHSEIRVTDATGNQYASPQLIYHYVIHHQYQPPAKFIEAVLRGEFEEPPPPPPGAVVLSGRRESLDNKDPALANTLRQRVVRTLLGDSWESGHPERLVFTVQWASRDGIDVLYLEIVLVIVHGDVWDGTPNGALRVIDEALVLESKASFWRDELL
jgi:hypothetical protein